ncbi:MAG: UspA domain-containing protein [Planctomycetota bacterium]|nr:MAG: UspA domain-containing protein [Planctomycetota bacterium]
MCGLRLGARCRHNQHERTRPRSSTFERDDVCHAIGITLANSPPNRRLILERMAIVVSFKKILCPVDFSDLSLNAIRVAVDLASKFQAELHLLHVFEGYDAISLNPELAMSPMPEWLPKLRQLCHEKLAALPSADLAAQCTKIVRADREGPAIHEILEYAAHEKIDLIVLTTHGRTGLKHLLMGSVAENVVRSAKCPVLTLRGHDTPTS